MKKYCLAAALSMACLAPAAQADTLLGLYVGVDGWQSDNDGHFSFLIHQQSHTQPLVKSVITPTLHRATHKTRRLFPTTTFLLVAEAVEYDFADVLEKKNARVSLQQIIRELEATQETVWSPIILNGNGFGFVANHSLVMANYISRANAALIELSELLAQG